jgi:hypothetical protein
MLRATNAFMAALFALAAAVQWNDPDPARWIAVYAAASAGSLMAARSRPPHPALTVALAGIASAWAMAIASGVDSGSYARMLDAWEMKSPAIEAAREVIGLLLVGAWMFVVAITASRPRRDG